MKFLSCFVMFPFFACSCAFLGAPYRTALPLPPTFVALALVAVVVVMAAAVSVR